MARLKIGNGITLEAQLPKVEQYEPKVEQLDIMALVQKAIDSLPKPQPIKEVITHQKEVDLTGLATHQDVAVELDKLEDRFENVNLNLIKQMTSLQNMVEEIQNTKIELPEVKHITHVKDVSSDVIDYCNKLLQNSEKNVMIKVSDLQKQNRKQKVMNYVLGSVLILTVFLHLI